MNTEEDHYMDEANQGLIVHVAEYYNETKRDLEVYQDMGYTILEAMAVKHLMHWKKELHDLIFNGMNCHKRCA